MCTNDEGCDEGGICMHGRCQCKADWLCPTCGSHKSDVVGGKECDRPLPLLPPPDVGGGDCSTTLDCFAGKGGKCLAGRCSCRRGYTCSHCTAIAEKLLDGADQCPTTWPPELPDGGGTCISEGDCGVYDGGQCIDGACACRHGWTCPWCNLRLTEMMSGANCPTKPSKHDSHDIIKFIDEITASAASKQVFWVLVVSLALLFVEVLL
eukprot:TRINITY_DN6100_c0_g2_i1.p2 TRINITY_DN6100_c0_g2~~TRINITY_DN6100_c0_g2_i1.p2  ORF type:complete len:208 (+),score=54.08 TRINITY_DN6100_c0_g2_i1:1005-1628(+)